MCRASSLVFLAVFVASLVTAQAPPVVTQGSIALPRGQLAVAHHPHIGAFGRDVGFFRELSVLRNRLFLDGQLLDVPALADVQSDPMAAVYHPDLDEVWVGFSSRDVVALDRDLNLRRLPRLPSGVLAAGAMAFVPVAPKRGVWVHLNDELYVLGTSGWEEAVSGLTRSGWLAWYPPSAELVLTRSSTGFALHYDPVTNSLRTFSETVAPPAAPFPAQRMLWSFMDNRHALLPGPAESERLLVQRTSLTVARFSSNFGSFVVDGDVIRVWIHDRATNPTIIRPAELGRAEAFGGGCAPVAGGIPPRLLDSLTRNVGPNPGRTYFLNADDLVPSAPIVLILGLSRTDLPLGPDFPACGLFASSDLVVGLGVSANARAVFSLGQPAPATPLGISLFAQLSQFVPGANAGGALFSNGLALTVGNRW